MGLAHKGFSLALAILRVYGAKHNLSFNLVLPNYAMHIMCFFNGIQTIHLLPLMEGNQPLQVRKTEGKKKNDKEQNI